MAHEQYHHGELAASALISEKMSAAKKYQSMVS